MTTTHRTLIITLSLAALLGGDAATSTPAQARPAAGAVRRTVARVKGWVQTTLALRRAGVTRVVEDGRFTRGSIGGGVYTPGLRSQAKQLRREVHALRKAATRIVRSGGTLSFFAGKQLLGTFESARLTYRDRDKVRIQLREGVLKLASGASKVFSVRRAKNPKDGRARAGSLRTSILASETIRQPGQRARRIQELVIGKTTRGEHSIGNGKTSFGRPRFDVVESYDRTRRGRGRMIDSGEAAPQHELWSASLVKKALTLSIPGAK